MFRRHRDDLIAAQENERKALNIAITILADQVEYLRYQVNQQPHMSPALRELSDLNALDLRHPGGAPPERMFMSEEEEELLALRLNDHITEQDLEALRGDVAKVISLPRLEVDE